MVVGTNTPEKTFLEEKKRAWDTKDPGKGTEFVDMWFNDRKKRYQPSFVKNFESYSDVKLGDQDAKYTLILKTARTEGGWNIGVA